MGVQPLPWGLRPLTRVSTDWCRSALTRICSHSCCPPSTACCKQTSSFYCHTATKYAKNKQTLSRSLYINSQAAALCFIYYIHTSSSDFFNKIHMKQFINLCFVIPNANLKTPHRPIQSRAIPSAPMTPCQISVSIPVPFM